jgi:RND family efflux transporter MFP subunit
MSSSSRIRGMVIAALLIVVTVTVALWRGKTGEAGEKKSDGGAGVPVTVEKVQQRNVPHLLSSIGTVQSLQTVVIRPQITGVVTQVSFTEGQIVERGAVLARIDDRSIAAALAQAEAERASKQAQLKMAEVDLTRYRNLEDQHVISRQSIEQQSALVEQLRAGIQASDATIAAEKVQLSYATITSPVRGRVGIRRVDQGNLVQAGDANGLVTVTQIDPISILFTLPQEVLSRLRDSSGKPGDARVIAFERDSTRPLAEGRLSTFDNQIDTATGTLRLRAQFENRDGRLWPGQFVTLQLETGVSANAAVIPARAIQQGLNGPFVYRVQDAKAEVVPIVTTYQDDDIAVIASGVQAGDTIVIDGQSRLKPGAKVSATAVVGGENVAGT